MFRWRSEKNKVKAVFKLHFHVTQVVQSGVVDSLVLSIVPGDIGKPTTRLEKAVINNGVCKWENPVYETVKFIRDPKNGRFGERVYYFVISTGLSKASTFGDVSVDFADYAEATKISNVALPIKNSHSDAVLHVSIQRLQENNDKREEEECEDTKLKPNDKSLRTYLSNGDAVSQTKSDSSEISQDVSGNGNSERAGLSADCRTSSGSDVTLSSSDGSFGLDTPRELGLRNTSIHPTKIGVPSVTNHFSEAHKPAVNALSSLYDVHQRSSHFRDSSGGSEHGLSTEGSIHGSHDALPRERSHQASDIEYEKLKAEVTVLARQVDVSDMELQTLRKQIVKESKRGQELTKEVISLKEERDTLKIECENFKSFRKRRDDAKVSSRSLMESGDLHTLVEEIRQELNHEKDMNANLRLQLNKTQESNAELVLAVQDLDAMLEQKNSEILSLSSNYKQTKNSHGFGRSVSNCETDDDEQKELDELVKNQNSPKETHLLEKKITDLYGEIEMYRRDKDELEMQMEQLALDYEILKQENHDIAYKLEQSELQEQLKLQYECSPPPGIDEFETHIQNLENQLKKQSEEFSNSLETIKSLENQIHILEEELEKQAQGFESDLDSVTHDKVEQEQRAIRAEEALRCTRLKNANTAERLQDEFRKLSMQMATTFEANETATMRALREASELRVQKKLLEEMLRNVKEELQSVKADYEVKVNELSDKIDTMTVQMQQMLLEIDDKSMQLENQKKHDELVGRDFQLLKAENEKLTVEISCLSEQVKQKEVSSSDLELMKKSLEEYETLLNTQKEERNELVSTISLLKKEAEQSLDELNRTRHLKDEEEKVGKLLHSELEALKAQYSDLERSHIDDETEKEILRKQIFQLNGELKKKDDALAEKSTLISQNSKEMTNLKEKIQTLKDQIKSKDIALKKSASSLFEKERELQSKIAELEDKVEELNQSIKVAADRSFTTTNDTSCALDENDAVVSSLKSHAHLSEKEAEIPVVGNNGDNRLSDVLTELSSLKEKDISMRTELKELQERYSEMSLKFAEVEGERQKLVMTVRSLKNARKH
ncbi:intracellular protein transport protein USO1-like [Vicia villosa]|uniref:intracellular protein transport protein USO1-like n=1 Tax=Vicia villosa TaxID=3911 RepID=UPI00273B5FC7|nr:intracellular protein transport protein USO1-like [Vicia villosa]